MKINILGQDYELLLKSEEDFPKLDIHNAMGLAELYSKQLIINKDHIVQTNKNIDNLREYLNGTVRHEIIHAYFHEAGLTDYSYDEVLVEWLSLQIPKMTKTFNSFYEKEEEFYNDKTKEDD